MPCVQCVLSEACYSFYSSEIFLLDEACGLLFVSDTAHPTRIRVIFQRWSVNKHIVERLIVKQPSTQFGLWSVEVFIIMITDATWKHTHTFTSQYMSHTAGHRAASVAEFDALLSVAVFYSNWKLVFNKNTVSHYKSYLFSVLSLYGHIAIVFSVSDGIFKTSKKRGCRDGPLGTANMHSVGYSFGYSTFPLTVFFFLFFF